MDVDLSLGLIDLSSYLAQRVDDGVTASANEQDLVECAPQGQVHQGGRGRCVVLEQGGPGGVRRVQVAASRTTSRVGNEEMKLVDGQWDGVCAHIRGQGRQLDARR
jgi:hypothetical protein